MSASPAGTDRSSPRVALVVPIFPQVSETFIVAKLAGLVGRGWDAHVVCDRRRDDLWANFPELAGLEDRVHERGGGLPAVRRGLALAPRRGQRGRALAYLGSRGLAGGRGPVGLARDAPLIALEPDVIHFEFGAIAVGRTYLGQALGGVPMTVSFRGYDLAFVALDEPDHYRPVWEAVVRVHCLGQDLWNRALAHGCPPDLPHQLIPPGVDLGRFRDPAPPRPGVLGRGEPLRILSVGRLEWKKGYQFGLRAVRRLVDDGFDVTWRIVGRGQLSEGIAFERHHRGLDDRVEMLGALPIGAMVDQLRWADVLLHPAVSEGFGNAVLEAQAMGVPVVATDADGLAENVDDQVTGFVVPRRDPAALADAMAALATDPALRARMSATGRPRVEEHFGLERQLDSWESFYRAVLGGSGPAARSTE